MNKSLSHSPFKKNINTQPILPQTIWLFMLPINRLSRTRLVSFGWFFSVSAVGYCFLKTDTFWFGAPFWGSNKLLTPKQPINSFDTSTPHQSFSLKFKSPNIINPNFSSFSILLNLSLHTPPQSPHPLPPPSPSTWTLIPINLSPHPLHLHQLPLLPVPQVHQQNLPHLRWAQTK